jgi:hypothetical protein
MATKAAATKGAGLDDVAAVAPDDHGTVDLAQQEPERQRRSR